MKSSGNEKTLKICENRDLKDSTIGKDLKYPKRSEKIRKDPKRPEI
jgi:hypothetical protein